MNERSWFLRKKGRISSGSFHNGETLGGEKDESDIYAEATSNIKFITEYALLKNELQLNEPLRIFYPACGADKSLSEVFQGSEIFYMDINPTPLDKLRKANLPGTHIIEQSAIEHQPESLDIVVLRNAGAFVSEAVTASLKSGGIVIASDWSTSITANIFRKSNVMELIGKINYDYEHPTNTTLETGNIRRIRRQLRRDKPIRSKFGDVTFVFRKK